MEVLSSYIQGIDAEIKKDKKERRKQQMAVQRKDDSRCVLTTFGELEFKRTYYEDNKNDNYVYLADKVAGLEGYERVSLKVSADLVNTAAEVSYQKSSKYVTCGNVTRQTVKNKLRKINRIEKEKPLLKKVIKTLYIAADKDHVNLQNSTNTIVPLIVVYEGIKNVSKGRCQCVNSRYFGRYGTKTEDLWYEVLKKIQEGGYKY